MEFVQLVELIIEPLKTGAALLSIVSSVLSIRKLIKSSGAPPTIRLIVDGKEIDTTVTIGDRDKVFVEQAGNSSEEAPQQGDSAENKLGMSVRELSSATSDKIGTGGVVVQAVRPGSFADQQGLAPGLVITRINRQATASKAQFDKVVEGLKSGQDVVFEIVDPKHPERGINFLGGTLP